MICTGTPTRSSTAIASPGTMAAPPDRKIPWIFLLGRGGTEEVERPLDLQDDVVGHSRQNPGDLFRAHLIGGAAQFQDFGFLVAHAEFLLDFFGEVAAADRDVAGERGRRRS